MLSSQAEPEARAEHLLVAGVVHTMAAVVHTGHVVAGGARARDAVVPVAHMCHIVAGMVRGKSGVVHVRHVVAGGIHAVGAMPALLAVIHVRHIVGRHGVVHVSGIVWGLWGLGDAALRVPVMCLAGLGFIVAHRGRVVHLSSSSM